jgi:hypothetical protein
MADQEQHRSFFQSAGCVAEPWRRPPFFPPNLSTADGVDGLSSLLARPDPDRLLVLRPATASTWPCCLQCLSCIVWDMDDWCGAAGLQDPSSVLLLQGGECQRVMLMLQVRGCCTNRRTGVMEHDLPPELLQRVSLDELRPWLQELPRMNGLQPPDCCDCLSSTCCICLPCLWLPCLYCAQYHSRRWSRALSDWQQRLNIEQLRPRGLYINTRSHCRVTFEVSEGSSSKRREIRRWLAVALTPREVEILQQEPHLSGGVEPPCCGLDAETAYVLHS